MGILLLPIFLAMLLGFSYHGIKTGVIVIFASKKRLNAVFGLTAMSVGLATAEIVLPFAFVASSEVSAGGFPIVVVFVVGSVAGLVGIYFRDLYRRTAQPVHGLFSTALFLAGGGFPILWFWLAERMQIWFKVKWIY